MADLIGPELGWDEGRIGREAEAYAGARRAELSRAGLDPGPDRRRAGAARGGGDGRPTPPGDKGPG